MPKVLIADDNIHNRNICKLALDHIGFPYEEAADGKEALDLLMRDQFNILLLDLDMPNMNGPEVLRFMEFLGVNSLIFTIIITAHAQLAAEVADAAELVMYKPIDITMFAQFLQQLPFTS